MKATPALSAILGMSLVLNVFLFLRPRAAAPQTDLAAVSILNRDLERLRSQLFAEQGVVAELKERVQAAPSAAPEPAAVKPSMVSRTTLRKVMAEMARRQSNATAAPDPELEHEAVEFMLQFVPTLKAPSQDPERYVEFMSALFAEAVDGGGHPLTTDEMLAIERAGRQFVLAMTRVPASPAAERQIGELEGQFAFARDVFAALTPEQRTGIMENAFVRTVRTLPDARPLEAKAFAGIVKDDWRACLGLTETQAPYLETTAGEFRSAVERINSDFAARFGISPSVWRVYGSDGDLSRDFDHRAQILRAQVAALMGLQDRLTPAQRTILSGQRFWYYEMFEDPPDVK